MKTRKRRVEVISFYNHTGLEKHFSKMARKGWLIESISNYYWTYCRIEPKNIHFCVTYYAKASDFDPEPSPDQQNFHDFCAHTGWQLCCSWHQMQVFYNEQADPVPLETDPVLEVETLHKACKKNYLPGQFLLLVMGFLMGGLFTGRIFADPIGLLSNGSQILTGFSFFCMAVLAAGELGAYYFWYFKARKAAQNGVYVDTPNTAGLQWVVLVSVLAGLVLWLVDVLTAGDRLYMWITVGVFAGIIVIHAAVNSIKFGLKKAKVSRGSNRALTLAACFVLPFLLTGTIVYVVLISNISQGVDKQPEYEQKMPLSLSDLTKVEADCQENVRMESSVLLSRQTVEQYAGDPQNMPHMHYTVITIKAPFLSEWCKNHAYRDEVARQARFDHTYEKRDAGAWEAEEVYCLMDAGGGNLGQYLLLFENRFVELWLSWEPSVEQMAVIGEKLNP